MLIRVFESISRKKSGLVVILEDLQDVLLADQFDGIGLLFEQVAHVTLVEIIHRVLDLLDAVAEVLRDLVADVGVEQRPADVLQGLGYIDIGNLPFALQNLEGPLQSL